MSAVPSHGRRSSSCADDVKARASTDHEVRPAQPGRVRALRDGGRLPLLVVLGLARERIGDRVHIVGDRADVVGHRAHVARDGVEVVRDAPQILGYHHEAVPDAGRCHEHGENRRKTVTHAEPPTTPHGTVPVKERAIEDA